MTTSYLTHSAIERHLSATDNYGHDGPVYLSPGRSIGQRLIPMARDLTFLWEEASHETLDENKQKVRDAGRRAILDWARSQGEGTDYTDNLPIQRFNPPGPLLRGAQPARATACSPGSSTTIPTCNGCWSTTSTPWARTSSRACSGWSIESGATLSFEVIPRRIDDRGGGLARVGRPAPPARGTGPAARRHRVQAAVLQQLTTWVTIDGLLEAFGLTRDDLEARSRKVAAAVRAMAARVPTYVTIKDVKRRWGHGQEDVYPVAQFEKLWGDLSSLPDLNCSFLAVDRRRGQQLKDAAQLDGWANDGSMDHVQSLCDFAR